MVKISSRLIIRTAYDHVRGSLYKERKKIDPNYLIVRDEIVEVTSYKMYNMFNACCGKPVKFNEKEIDELTNVLKEYNTVFYEGYWISLIRRKI